MVNIFFILSCIILAILFGKLINVDTPERPRILSQVVGSIDKGNFSYFYIHNHGSFILHLTSLTGDADMYISDSNLHPTYNPEFYTLHSATCGEDIIHVPDSHELPIAVGIYGYAETSMYILDMYESPDYPDLHKQWISIEKVASTKTPTRQDKNAEVHENSDNKKSINANQNIKKKKTRPKSSVSNVFSVLEILQLIFL